jgi:DNA-binding CsgD family transcriptional regulator
MLDSALRPLAFNWEAAEILSYPERPSVDHPPTLRIPEEVRRKIRSSGAGDPPPIMAYFRAGRREYMCQAYFLKECCDGHISQPMVALLLQRNSSATETIYELAARFHLTDREREALRGLSLGLTSKELAENMNISPNTVKVHLRLMMTKMGVNTRGAIIAKILEHSPVTQPAKSHQAHV